MSHSRRGRYDSLSPARDRSLSISYSRSRSRSRSRESHDVSNPGNNLYVTGLSHRITKRDLETTFSKYGTVLECHLVVDPRTRESRGFGFVTMDTIEDAGRCIKYLDGTVLEGRVITVEKARRKRGRTPTPGKYLGVRPTRGRDYDRRRNSRSSDRYSSRRSPSYSPYRGGRYRSPSYSPRYDRRYRRSTSHYYRRDRSYSPYRRDRSPYSRRSSTYGRRRHSLSRSASPYRHYSPYGRRDRSVSPYYYRKSRSSLYGGRDRSLSRSVSPYRNY